MRTRRPARRTEARTPNTRRLFCRSAVVLGRPRPAEGPCDKQKSVRVLGKWTSVRRGDPEKKGQEGKLVAWLTVLLS